MLCGKLISGGQTGADRAALDFALAQGIPHGGWCPRGRLAEDGKIDARYQLTETPSPDSAQRTEWNVRDSDGTVILSISRRLQGGSQKTVEFAVRHRKPFLHLSREANADAAGAQLVEFIGRHKIETLNVAGPRASEEPEVRAFSFSVLKSLKSDETRDK